jgi:hypothetical protein
VASRRCWFSNILLFVSIRFCMKDMPRIAILLSVPQQKWKIQENRKPVTVDEKQDGKEGVDCGFRDDVRVKTVAEVNRVDVVTVVVWLALYRRGWMRRMRRVTDCQSDLAGSESGE